MCGISGVLDLRYQKVDRLIDRLNYFNEIQKHRGPDDNGTWKNKEEYIGFGHQRLSIIDISSGQQPMENEGGSVICYNGELYNYIELRDELKAGYSFKTDSDTEVILAAYEKWGSECLDKFRGMFAFAIWDEGKKELFCARDRFGIKPFYYFIENQQLHFASEAKTLLPFISTIETDTEGLKDYFVFQLTLGQKTLFKGIKELGQSHFMIVKSGQVDVKKYWEVYYDFDLDHTHRYFEEHLNQLMHESIELHMRSDVPVGSYISGGVDSSLVAAIASGYHDTALNGFVGKFELGELYDESEYARIVADQNNINLFERSITSTDFLANISKIIYHLDYPVAGPGSFPQYMISETAAKYNKVVLGGQGGDEIFGGYTRYLIAYFEQCIKGAIEGTLDDGNFIVTYESIIPNLRSLKNYTPLLKKFWSKGLFENIDKRYFHLIDRAPTLKKEVRWDLLGDYDPFSDFCEIFNSKNVGKESYFDKMTHFDFKTLLPGLLQVEDRMSMAHGLESRVPFLDHKIVEFAATIPSDVKFKDGKLKRILVNSMRKHLPDEIANRQDKMGFPVPLNDWMQNELKEFVTDVFSSTKALNREYIDNQVVLDNMNEEKGFGRKMWGLLSLEIWHQNFHDKEHEFKKKFSKISS